MDAENPWAAAIAWRDGIVEAIGDDAAVREVCDATTEVIDARGGVITPGLIDGHQHVFMGAVSAQGLDLDRISSLAALREAIAGERKRLGAGAWIQGFSLEYEAFEGLAYDHSLLDDAAGEGPMVLVALDVHTAYANAEAMRIAGLDGARRFGDGSIVIVDDNGSPTGELKEWSAMAVVMDHTPKPSDEQRRAWYRETIAAQNAVGLVGLHLMDGGVDTVALLDSLESEGELNTRVLLHHFIYPTTSDEEVEAILATRARAGRRWAADGVKFMLDGVIDTGTAWLEEPDAHGQGGEPMWPEIDHYRKRIRQFHDAGFRIATHAIGDRAVREVLDTYTTLPGGSAGRHRIEHIETAPDSLVARFAPEGVTASMQPIHLRWLKPDLSDPWSKRLDHERCSHAMRSGDLSAAGALVVLGSDWPVAPYDPRFGFFAAQQRRSHDVDDPRPIGASVPLTGEQTLAGYTVNSARAVGDSAGGSLAVGKRADLVSWVDDPAAVNPNDVTDLAVQLTVIDGQVVHRTLD